MKRKKFIRKVEKFASEEISKDLRQHCGEDFSIGPIMVNPDYKALRERQPGEPRDVLITVVYEGDMSEATLQWQDKASIRIWKRMREEWIENFYPTVDYIPKSKWESGELQEREDWW